MEMNGGHAYQEHGRNHHRDMGIFAYTEITARLTSLDI